MSAPEVEAILNRHVFGEATGGYVACSCGWPTRKQWDDGEYEVIHVIVELRAAGVLDEVGLS